MWIIKKSSINQRYYAKRTKHHHYQTNERAKEHERMHDPAMKEKNILKERGLYSY